MKKRKRGGGEVEGERARDREEKHTQDVHEVRELASLLVLLELDVELAQTVEGELVHVDEDLLRLQERTKGQEGTEMAALGQFSSRRVDHSRPGKDVVFSPPKSITKNRHGREDGRH